MANTGLVSYYLPDLTSATLNATWTMIKYILGNTPKDERPPPADIDKIVGFIWSPTKAIVGAMGSVSTAMGDLSAEAYKDLVTAMAANKEEMLTQYLKFKQGVENNQYMFPTFGDISAEQVGKWITELVSSVVSMVYNVSTFFFGGVPGAAKEAFSTFVDFVGMLNANVSEALSAAVTPIGRAIHENIQRVVFMMNSFTWKDFPGLDPRNMTTTVGTTLTQGWEFIVRGVTTIVDIFKAILPAERLDVMFVQNYGAEVAQFFKNYMDAGTTFLNSVPVYTTFFTEIVQTVDKILEQITVYTVDTTTAIVIGLAKSFWETAVVNLGIAKDLVADVASQVLQEFLNVEKNAVDALNVVIDTFVAAFETLITEFAGNTVIDIMQVMSRLRDLNEFITSTAATTFGFLTSPMGASMLAMAAAGPVAYQLYKWYKKYNEKPHLHRDFRMYWKVIFFMQSANRDEWACANEGLRDKLEPHLVEYFNRGQNPYVGEFKIRNNTHRVLLVPTLGETDSDKTFPLILLINPKSMQLIFPCILELPETTGRKEDQIMVTQEQANLLSSKELLQEIGFVPQAEVKEGQPPEFVNRTHPWFIRYWEAEELRNKFVSSYLQSTETLGYFLQDDDPNKWHSGKKLRPALYNFVRSYMKDADKIRKDNFVSQYSHVITIDGLDVTLIPNYTEYRKDLFLLVQDEATDRARAVFFCPMVLPTHGGANLLQTTDDRDKRDDLLKKLSYPMTLKELTGTDVIDRYSTLQRS